MRGNFWARTSLSINPFLAGRHPRCLRNRCLASMITRGFCRMHFLCLFMLSNSSCFYKWAFATELKNDCACVTFDPVGQSSFEIAQSARHLARKYRLEQHIPNETLEFAVTFWLVFRYETVVSRRYVLALLLVGLLRKFEAYLVYLTLI